MSILHIPALLVSSACVLLLSACGPSEAEQELSLIKHQLKIDSVDRLIEEKRLMITDSIQNVGTTIREMESGLIRAKAELATAQDRLQRVSQFQLGRSRGEREEQIRQTTIAIEEIKKWIDETEGHIASWKEHEESLRAQVRN